MANRQEFNNQVRLLISLLSFINQEKIFALKGGTAINLFVRDFPRLSVDIDLVYLPLNSREIALKDCHDALSRIAEEIQKQLANTKVVESFQHKNDALRLIVSQNRILVKIELSPVLRGVVYPTEWRTVHPKVEEEFGFAEMNVVSFSDLYAGKICAALDRQHPRDLFDVKVLLENEGLSIELRKAFLVYLICHPRPMHEMLQPRLKALDQMFLNEFSGMAFLEVTVQELEEVRVRLIDLIRHGLTNDEKEFLISLYQSEPQWYLLGIEQIEKLPAVQWKLQNINRMSAEKKQNEIAQVNQVLEMD